MPDNTPRYIDRPPRIQPELPQGTVDIPNPPKTEESTQETLIQSVVPIITIIGYVLVSATGNGSNMAFMIPMALTVFISTGITLYIMVKKEQQRREREEAYKRRLVELRRDMVASHNRQRTFYEYNYPESSFVLNMRGDHQDNRGGTRLWERRSQDDDFGVIRLGKGVRESTVEYKLPQQQNEENPLRADAERLAADSKYVDDVPITIKLYEAGAAREKRRSKKEKEGEKGQGEAQKKPAQTLHTLGIAGDPKDVYEVVYGLVTHMAAFHSPNDVMVSVLGMRQSAANWGWAYSLPHTWINRDKGQYRLYFEDCDRVFAPYSGTIEAIKVQTGKTFPAGTVVARIRRDDNGALADVVSPVAGRVQEFGRVMAGPGEAAPLIDAGRHVEAGMLIMRLEDYALTAQQLDEETDPRKEMFTRFGKTRKREVAGVPRFWKEKIWQELDRRARRLRDRDENDRTEISLPFLFNIIDLTAARPDLPDEQNPLKNSYLDDLESEAAISLLISQGLELGGAVIFLLPDRRKVPSGCQSVLELKRDADGELRFLYAETGLNTARYVGAADTIINQHGVPNKKLRDFANALAEWKVRSSYGADIPRAVGLLPLYDSSTITDLHVPERWRESMDPKRAEWPKVPLGMMAGQEPRYLHFFADADGVHGMIAGSTGSGKSELLMTMILSLAVKYDPSMVNFVLVDFKGGAAFEPFKELPHVVDFVTNLRGNAVARMFAAINAELNRRQRVNQETDMKDIVRYKRAGLHLKRQDNYPHLFIIIDEFAEMIANNAEYKAQLDSITRLGRALGVSLILAAQRPTGVTDQMRANIKFRICLRVETREESAEMLRLPDGAYLPSIPGRGYLQVGSESLELLQVGYTGETYLRNDYDPDERYEARRVIWEEDLGKEEDEPAYDVMVRRMAKWATQLHEKKIWFKPWPKPLPNYLALDQTEGIEVEYLRPEDYDYVAAELLPDQPFVLAPAIPQWMDGRLDAWKGIDWENRAMRAVIGLIDDAHSAQLHTLKINLTVGHHMILGGAGWGKSTFLRTVITSLLATHAPDELNLYMLDFGSRSLAVFADMPHTGAYIVTHEKERVERLMRKLEQIIDTRKEILSAANVARLPEYNQLSASRRRKDLPEKLPAILVVVDNFAELKEGYENEFELFISLVREGLSNGVYFLLSGEQSNAFGKIFALIPERLTLKLSDDGEYSTIVGRGAYPVDEIAGRGLRRVERTPLEIQVAMPLGFVDDEEVKTEADRLSDFLNILKQAARKKQYPIPPQVDILESWSVLPKLIEEHKALTEGETPGKSASGVIGRNDFDLAPFILNLEAKLHFVVTGPPSSGKTTALQSWIMSLAELYSPDKVALVLVGYQGGLADYGGTFKLDNMPHVLMECVSEPAHFETLLDHLENEYFNIPNRPDREIFVFIDNYDDMDDMLPKVTADSDPKQRLGNLARRCGKQGLHFVICGMRDKLASADEFVRPVSANRYGLAMDVESAEASPLYGAVPRSLSQLQLPRGRGFVTMPGKVSLVQVAVPYEDPAGRTDYMDGWVEQIINRGQPKAEWMPMVEKKPRPEAASNGAGRPKGLSEVEFDYLLGKLAESMEITPDLLRDSFVENHEGLLDMCKERGITLEGMLAEANPGD